MGKSARTIIFFASLVISFILQPVLAQDAPADLLYARLISTSTGRVYLIYTGSVTDGAVTEIATLNGTGSDAGWSPDGRFIYLISLTDNNSRSLTLLNVAANTRQVLTNQLLPDMCSTPLWWSPDGRFLIYLTGDNASPEVMLLDTQADVTEKLPDAAGNTIYNASWSPDSRYFAYLSGEAATLNNTLIYAIETGQVIARLPADTGRGMHWLAGNRIVYTPTDDAGSIVVFNLQAGSQQAYPGEYAASVSPDGRYLVSSSAGGTVPTHLIDTTENLSEPLDGSFDARAVLWSPDSQYLIYNATVDNILSTVLMKLSDKTTLVLVFEPLYPYLVRWSPDGHTVAFTQELSGNHSLSRFWIFDLDTENSAQFDMDLSYVRTEPTLQWSPDGSYLVIHAADGLFLFESASWITNLVDATLGKHLFALHWSADGHYLSFNQMNDPAQEQYVMDMQDSTIQRLPDLSAADPIFLGWRGSHEHSSLIFCGMG